MGQPIRRIAINTGGGDAPGLSAVIRTDVKQMSVMVVGLLVASFAIIAQLPDSVGLSGEDAVGLLGIGRVREAGVLLEKVVQRLTASLARYLPEAPPSVQVQTISGCNASPRSSASSI